MACKWYANGMPADANVRHWAANVRRLTPPSESRWR